MPDASNFRTFIVSAPDGAVYEVQAPADVTEEDVLRHVQAAQEANAPRMSPEDEQAYTALAADPKSTPSDISGFLRQRGFTADERGVADFVQRRSQKGAVVSDGPVRYQLPKAPPKPKKERPNTGLENTSATAQEFLNGVLPNSGRFMAGVGGAIGNTIAAPLSSNVDWDPIGAFQQGQGDSDLDRERLEQDNPGIANTAYGGGVVTSFFLPQARVLRGGGLGAGAVNGAITNAGYGALSGAMNDTGDGRAANALNGGTVGGTLGALSPVAAQRLGALGSAARRNIPGVDAAATFLGGIPGRLAGRGAPNPDGAAHAQAERILGDMLPDSGINTGMGTTGLPATPPNITVEVASRANLGVPAMPADVSEKARRITGWALNGQGPMAQRARAVLSQRQAQSAQRIRGHLADELGPPVDPIQEAQAITQRARTAADQDYRQAYAQGSPMLITDELAGIMRRPAFQDALPQAYRNIRNRGGNPEDLGFVVGRDGSVSIGKTPSFEAFDQVVRTMNGQLKRNPMTGRLELDNETGAINDVMGSLDSHLRQQNPAFDAAKSNFADEMAIRDAMQRGQDVTRLSGPEIESQLRTMPQHAQESWMAGARTAVADDAINAGLKPNANVAQRVRQGLGLSGAGSHAALGDQAKLQAIETMSGRPGVMNRLDDRLEGEDQAFKTFSESFGNSKTQPRQAMDEAMSGEALQVAGNMLHGNWTGAVSAALFKGNPAGTLRYKGAVQDRIAEIMTATNPRTVGELMDAITRRAQTDDAFRDLLNRSGITAAKAASIQAAGQDARAAPLSSDPDFEGLGQEPDDMPFPAYTRIQP